MSRKPTTEAERARRDRRDRARRDRRLIRDFLPPEGVPLNFEVASLGMRLAAQLTDLLLTGLFVVALMTVLAITGILSWSGITIVGALAFFFIRAPYYIVAELIWNGQTLGKRICRARVVSADGRSLRPFAITVRNLMKELEVFVPGTALFMAANLSPVEYVVLLLWIAILLAVPLTNRKRQRLGDMIAGTYVIHQPQAVLMPDLSARAAGSQGRFAFMAHQLDHYGAYELQVLERVLHVDTRGFSAELAERHRKNLIEIAERIRAKIDYTERVEPRDVPEFLEAFYLAQRRYLESRKLFGDARQDKYHHQDREEAAP